MKSLIIFLLSCTVISVTAKAPITAQQALDKSSTFFNTLTTFSLSFKVKTLYDITEEEKEYTGTLMVGPKDKFVLDHSELKMVSDGVTLWEHRKAHKQVLIKSLIDMESGFHTSEIIFKYLKCTPLTIAHKKEKNTPYLVLTLDPSKQITYLKGMKVWLDPTDFSPKRLKTIDVSDNVSWYTIDNFKSNPPVNDKTFTYTPALTLETIDMR
ncbi:MAG: outer membrane lipoprotein carrier protein LolA [Fibrobacterales bacterium]